MHTWRRVLVPVDAGAKGPCVGCSIIDADAICFTWQFMRPCNNAMKNDKAFLCSESGVVCGMTYKKWKLHLALFRFVLKDGGGSNNGCQFV